MPHSNEERRPLLATSGGRSMSTVRDRSASSEEDVRVGSESPDAELTRNSHNKFSPLSHPQLRHDDRSATAPLLWQRYLSSPGITLSFQDVTIVQRRFWKSKDQRLLVQACNGFFEPAKLHVVVDIERTAMHGRALMDVLSGSAVPGKGIVTGNNIPVSSARFRPAVGMVATKPETVFFGNLSVVENISFALEMRCKCPNACDVLSAEEIDVVTTARDARNRRCCASGGAWPFACLRFGTEAQLCRAHAAASFFDLDPNTRARELTAVQRFLLVVAMELVLDPPILFISAPGVLGSMDPHTVSEIVQYLKRICTVLGKTLVCLLPSLPFPVFERMDTVVLLGLEGQTLYSGDKADMLSYFSTLGLPPTMLSSPMYDSFSRTHRPSSISLISANRKSTRSDDDHHHAVSSFGPSAAPHSASNRTESGAEEHRRRSASAPIDLRSSPSRGDEQRSHHVPSSTAHGGGENDEPPLRRDTTAAFVEGGAQAPPASPLRLAAIGREGSAAETEALIVDTGDAAVDLAVLWSENLATTVRFAAVFYDSAVRKQTTAKQDEHAQEGDNALASTMSSTYHRNNNISFLKFQPQSSWRQVQSLTHIFFLQSLRKSDLYILWLILTILLGFTAWLVSNQNNDKLGMMNIRGIIFLLLFVTLQVNVGYADMYCAELELYRFQRDSGFYTLPVYLLVFVVRLVASRIVFLATAVPFVMYLLETSKSLITMVGLLSVAHATTVYCEAALFRQTRLVQLVSLLYVGYCVVFSGFLVNLTSLPSIIGYLSLMRNGYAAAVAEELRGKPYTCDAGNSSLWVNHTGSYCYYGDEYLQLEGFAYDSDERSANAFIVVTVVALAIIALRMWCM